MRCSCGAAGSLAACRAHEARPVGDKALVNSEKLDRWQWWIAQQYMQA